MGGGGWGWGWGVGWGVGVGIGGLLKSNWNWCNVSCNCSLLTSSLICDMHTYERRYNTISPWFK